MGLVKDRKNVQSSLMIPELGNSNRREKVIALAGNPNVGKSTLFNALTGMNQHTGNWPGKTVAVAQGQCQHQGQKLTFIDLPGCYSLATNSAEEDVARDFIYYANPMAVVVVCDATCLERSLNLVLQIMEITERVIVCVNLSDEAAKKGIIVDTKKLSLLLGVQVVATAARNKLGLRDLLDKIVELPKTKAQRFQVTYHQLIEDTITELIPVVEELGDKIYNTRWLAIKLIESDYKLLSGIEEHYEIDLRNNDKVNQIITQLKASWQRENLNLIGIEDQLACDLVNAGGLISSKVVTCMDPDYNRRDRKFDKILTSKWTGFPVMLLVLMLIFWITISGANYPSQYLSTALFWLEEKLIIALCCLKVPDYFIEMLIFGIYRVVAWVIAVMLPPMAIFFPLFTLLEDSGYLPRIAFNLDKVYKKCCACGKQALTMCMGFGCNAVGVVGCRIIDSPRERLIAIITNSFVPCNGRFPSLIAIISMFFIGATAGLWKSALSAFILTALVVLSIVLTFMVSKFLSLTILKGTPSSFTLELPPYRCPRIFQVIIRSVFDRTAFVLSRAIKVAAPAGLLIWLLANTRLGDSTLLIYCASILDPFAKAMGMDGIILLAFILGIPANEIVLPIIIMAYMANGNLVNIDNLSFIKELLLNNGWSWVTAASVILFSLTHWPCATTLLTIKNETNSCKWALLAFILPTLIGILICLTFNFVAGYLVA